MTVESPVGVLQTEVPGGKDIDVSPYQNGLRNTHHSMGSHSIGSDSRASPDVVRPERLQNVMDEAFQQIKSPTSTAKLAEQAMKRRTAAEWIHTITGETLPVASDQEFRSRLRDGTLLCKILNSVKPGTITRIVDINELETNAGEVIQTMENVTNFLKGAQAVGIPEDYIFKLGDLEDTGTTDRPRVVACLLCLKRMSEGKQLTGEYSTPARSPYGNSFAPRRHSASYRMGSPASEVSSDAYDDGPTPPMRMAAGKGVAAAVGVTRLMKQCTQMLQDRMWTDNHGLTPTPPRGTASGPEALGSVLESVLGSLTQEYEKRLLSKDHEVNNMRDSMLAEQAKSRALEAELSIAKNAAALAVAQASSSTSLLSEKESSEASEALQRAREDLEMAQEESRRLREEMALFEEHSAAARRDLEEELLLAQERIESLVEMEDAYKKVCVENRYLYNTVQDLKGAIRVYCRVRPLGMTGDSTPSCLDVCDNEIAAYNDKGLRKLYQFDKVFPESTTQSLIYDETAPLVRSVLDGYNVCIFAYGQTGSGKTHTMSGTDVHELHGRGINYRALDDLFDIAANRSGEWNYTINVQMLEIYNETLRDLLVDSSVSKKDNRLDIRMTERSGNNVPDATQVRVSETNDVLEIMARGASNRAVGETKMNDRSSRSHQVVTVMVDGRNSVTGVHTHACLNLIDLAGSERVQRSEATGDRLREAQHINKSLSALGDVMSSLANGNAHVPYRNSKLTQLLQDSLGGQAKTMMFMHIAPEISSYGETVSTLGFGTRVSQVTLGAAKQNREGAELFAAREAIARLEAGNQEADAAADRLKAEVADLRAESAEGHGRADRAEARLQALSDELERLRAEVAHAQDTTSKQGNTPNLSLDLNGARRGTDAGVRAASKISPAVKVPLREAQALSPQISMRSSVTTHVQRLRSKENGQGPPSKLQRPQSARSIPSSSASAAGQSQQPRGAMTHRSEHPTSAGSTGGNRKLSSASGPPPVTPTAMPPGSHGLAKLQAPLASLPTSPGQPLGQSPTGGSPPAGAAGGCDA
eukprot:CAMPEP_0117660610 /NCGR_PEP_ID=MMETSP0804-20121206/7059_1 /TAXON_ID=1074897 /ORGANISM="Tetraselmis astigmatica, Strain CCMP880" /LENGTH=1042 /DNA_ID=CAMNT_0005467349 /DNA_START=319 /DNA_END=3446 /DNA_ORIENTATION=-